MSDWERAICARVKTVRESINWSQASFAEQLGITRDQLASIEYGRTPLRYDIAWALRQAFGISLRWLEGDDTVVQDNFTHDNLPEPTTTGMPTRALLSAVVEKFPEFGGETLEVMGPQATGSPSPSAPPLQRPAAQVNRPSGSFTAPDALLELLGGQESGTGRSDPSHRAIHAEILKGLVDHWIARVPLGQVEAFSDKLLYTAEQLIGTFPAESSEAVDRRWDELIWERIKIANSKKILAASQAKKRVLTETASSVKLPPVKSQLDNLLATLNRLTKETGKKTELADYLGAPLASVSRWLSGEREPGGETTLKMLRWVQEQKSKPKTPGSATNTTKGKTQVRSSKAYEKQTQVRKEG